MSLEIEPGDWCRYVRSDGQLAPGAVRRCEGVVNTRGWRSVCPCGRPSSVGLRMVGEERGFDAWCPCAWRKLCGPEDELAETEQGEMVTA